MTKKFFKIVLKCLVIVTLFLLVFLVIHLFDWQGRYSYNHDFITIMGDEYFFNPSFFLHSEKEFRSASVGTTYEELVKRFGTENGQLNSNALKHSIYYALAVDRFIVYQLVPYFTNEDGMITETLVVWRISICDDKESLEVLAEDREIFDAAEQSWEEYVLKNKK